MKQGQAQEHYSRFRKIRGEIVRDRQRRSHREWREARPWSPRPRPCVLVQLAVAGLSSLRVMSFTMSLFTRVQKVMSRHPPFQTCSQTLEGQIRYLYAKKFRTFQAGRVVWCVNNTHFLHRWIIPWHSAPGLLWRHRALHQTLYQQR